MNPISISTTALARAMCRAGFVLLLALCAGSCTSGDLFTDDTRPDGNTDAANAPVRFNVAPRPGFREVNIDGTPAATGNDGTPANGNPPTTRMTHTDDAAQWENGDVLWLNARYPNTPECPDTIVSALIYDSGTWRYFTPEEAQSYVVSSSKLASYYKRELLWPKAVIKDADGTCRLKAIHVGNDVPDKDGTKAITGFVTCYMSLATDSVDFSPGDDVQLQLCQQWKRICFVKTCKLTFDHMWYEISLISFQEEKDNKTHSNYNAPEYFIADISSIEVNGHEISLHPDASGSYAGLSYTIDPDKLTNGPIVPEP